MNNEPFVGWCKESPFQPPRHKWQVIPGTAHWLASKQYHKFYCIYCLKKVSK